MWPTVMAFIVLGALVVACAQAPETGRSQLILVSDEQMNQAGAQAYRQVLEQQRVSQNTALQRRVASMGQRIAGVIGGSEQWEVTVIEDPTPNAFALPGGKVTVNTGLFRVAENDDQLAAVISHEIAHVTAHHVAEQVSQQIVQQGGLLALGALRIAVSKPVIVSEIVQIVAEAAVTSITALYSLAQESEADEIGLMYMARAGYNPRQAINLWQNMEWAGGEGSVEGNSTHPAAGSRIERLQALMPRALAEYRAAGGRG